MLEEDAHLLQEQLLRDEKIRSERRPLRSSLRLKETPPLDSDSLFGKGYFTVQDEASQLIAFLVDPQKNEQIADVCAGPGGKLSHVYELGQEQIELYAIEKDDLQLKRAQDNMQRLGFEKLTWVHQDFLDWKPRKKMDKILLDAPCTGLGVLRRHPEGKWHKSPEGIPALAETQFKMICHALTRLKVDGELIYSVCSFEPEESEAHAKRLIQEFGDKVEIVSPVSRLPDYFKKYVTRRNILSIYAGNPDGMDGFAAFIVKLKEKI